MTPQAARLRTVRLLRSGFAVALTVGLLSAPQAADLSGHRPYRHRHRVVADVESPVVPLGYAYGGYGNGAGPGWEYSGHGPGYGPGYAPGYGYIPPGFPSYGLDLGY